MDPVRPSPTKVGLDQDWLDRLEDPGFTPARRDLDPLLGALDDLDEGQSKKVERVLCRAGLPAASAACQRLPEANQQGAVSLVRVVGRILQRCPDPAILSCLLDSLRDARPKVQRATIVALGKTRLAACEEPLLALLDQVTGAEQRALVQALGQTGGHAARQRLQALTVADAATIPVLARARLLLERTQLQPSSNDRIRLDVPLPVPWNVMVLCRAGLASIMSEQLSGWPQRRILDRDRLILPDYRGPLGALFEARTMLRLALSLSLDVDPDDENAVTHALVERLCEPDCIATLQALTEGRPRLRLEVADQGHRRRLLWTAAQKLQERSGPLCFDPRASPWQVWLWLSKRPVRVWLLPHRFVDPRFEYRVRDVPAASHPTVAAALAHVAGVRDDDVVWDPFVGSGLELIERARLGPYRKLWGTDLDPRALAAARLNVERAAVKRISLCQGDARHDGPAQVTTILTCPPFGIRVARDGQLKELLDSLLERAKRVLLPGGRLVWLSPLPEQTARKAIALGLAVTRLGVVDVTGLCPELQVITKNHPSASVRSRAPGR